ncbi:alpha/beta hydrolase-fold protein [Pelagicoccus sp. SDUM812003]|uniref:alpha/beta hydrolase n=1 Tax=Pelagicoccus sp. SDUM812003 TaxID=3041267 RepID=UPI00280E8838|nr:alpha/beta hydrolase-fold protein [Pelagicoccus sp. SDUM812003]MDQ8201459.1 alpha/beta hydrolase-fold protein [Pelagicoccus sp. SDUM812003]
MSVEKQNETELPFRTVECGALPVEGGTFTFVTVKSPNLMGRGDVLVFCPKDAEGVTNVPVVVLLHGVYCSHWACALSGRAHRVLSELIRKGDVPPMLLAMPSDGLWGDGSGYLRHSGCCFDKWIVDDVPKAVAQANSETEASPYFLAGLSMGGYGALRIGAERGDRFQAFSGHSSITRFEELSLFVEESLQRYEPVNNPSKDVIDVMRCNELKLSPFRFDCGVEDELIEGNRLLSDQLRQEGIPHVYEEFSGGHEWSYWEKHVAKSFRFFAEVLQSAERKNHV